MFLKGASRLPRGGESPTQGARSSPWTARAGAWEEGFLCGIQLREQGLAGMCHQIPLGLASGGGSCQMFPPPHLITSGTKATFINRTKQEKN